MKKLLLLSLLCVSAQATDTVLVITHAFNRPSFIELHYTTFKHFFTDPYEYVVFNDAIDQAMAREIEQTCAKLAIRCIRVPQSQVHPPHRQHDSQRVSDVIHYSLELIGFDHDGIVAIVDSDMFPIKKISIVDSMRGYDIHGCTQHRGDADQVMYLWNGIIFMDMRTLPNKRTMNWDCGRVHGWAVDTGGQLHHYLQANPTIRLRDYQGITFDNLLNNEKELARHSDFVKHFLRTHPINMEFYMDNSFLHYRSGANSDRRPINFHIVKEHILNQLLDYYLAQ